MSAPNQTAARTLRFGVFEVDIAARELRRRGVRMKLQDQPFRVLEALLERPGEIVTREELKDRLWAEDEFVEFDKSLNTAIQKIRQTLGDSAESPRFLETVPKVGYRFIAGVSQPHPAEERPPQEPADNDSNGALSWKKAAPWALAATLALALVWREIAPAPTSAGQSKTRHFTIGPQLHGPPVRSQAGWVGHRPSAAISPDGSKIAYLSAEEPSRLWIHDLSTGESEPVAGTEIGPVRVLSGADTLTWSPDGESIAYLTESAVKRASLEAGGITTLHSLGPSDAIYQGAAWSPDGGTLVVSAGTAGGSELLSIPAAGGEAAPLAQRPDSRGTEPAFLPGSEPAVVCRRLDALYLLNLRTGEDSLLLDDAVNPSWSPTGHLMFDRQGAIWALPFSLDALEPTGEAFLVKRGFANGGVSADGTLLAVTSRIYEDRVNFAIRDREGRLVSRFGPPLTGSGGPYGARHPSVSPDGRKVAVSASLQPDVSNDIWVFDIGSERPQRLTASATNDDNPVWTPDGRRIVFRRGGPGEGAGDADLYIVDASGGEPEALLDDDLRLAEPDFSPNGDFLMIQQRRLDARQFDLKYIEFPPKSGSPERVAWRETEFNETHPQFSPDGAYVAYASGESLRGPHIRPFPTGSPVWDVSPHAGNSPRWSPDGHTLYWWSSLPGHPIVATGIDFSKPNPIGESRRVFDTGRNVGTFHYDVMPDGRLLVLEPLEEERTGAEPSYFRVSLNWFEEFRSRNDAE